MFFWQYSDIIVRIHVFIEDDQIANTVVANDPHTITVTIRFLLTMRRHSGIYLSPAVLHTLTLPPQYERLNLDSSGKSKQDQLSGTVQLRVLVHHRSRRSRFSWLMSRFCTATRLWIAWPWSFLWTVRLHYDDVIMTMLASQITSLTVVYSIVYSGVNQRKHQSSASLVFVREIHRGPVNFPHKWPVTRKMFPFDDVIMWKLEGV